MGVRPASDFDDATAVRRVGQGRYDMRPDERFAAPVPSATGPAAVNGGALIATMLRATLDESTHPHPVATSAHFLRVPRIAPAQVQVTWLKQGRTAAVARASLIQDEILIIEATVATGVLANGVPDEGSALANGVPDEGSALADGVLVEGSALADGVLVDNSAAMSGSAQASRGMRPAGPEALSWTGEPPQLPPVEECIPLPRRSGIATQVDLRLDPDTAGWLNGKHSGTPEMRGYFRLRDGREPDAYLLALAVDAMPPVVFGLGAVSWAPTVELTWHMRAVPAAGLLRVAARCRHVSGGWFDEESEVWDSAGRLVAQSRQLARVGR